MAYFLMPELRAARLMFLVGNNSEARVLDVLCCLTDSQGTQYPLNDYRGVGWVQFRVSGSCGIWIVKVSDSATRAQTVP